MRLKFGEWLWSDAERRVQLERDYNEARNAYATAKFDGSFLGFEGMALSLGKGRSICASTKSMRSGEGW